MRNLAAVSLNPATNLFLNPPPPPPPPFWRVGACRAFCVCVTTCFIVKVYKTQCTKLVSQCTDCDLQFIKGLRRISYSLFHKLGLTGRITCCVLQTLQINFVKKTVEGKKILILEGGLCYGRINFSRAQKLLGGKWKIT